MKVVKSPLFAPALLLLLLSLTVQFDETGLVWVWHSQPGVGVALMVTSIVLWGLLFRKLRRH